MIEYLSKEVIRLDEQGMIADVYQYEVNREDINKVQQVRDKALESLMSGESSSTRIRLPIKKKDDKYYEILTDSLEGDRLIIATERGNKYYIMQYLIKQGKELILSLITKW